MHNAAVLLHNEGKMREAVQALRAAIAGDARAAGEALKAVEAGALVVPAGQLNLDRPGLLDQ